MSDRDFWVAAAKRLALRRNIAGWWDAFLPAGLGLTVAAAVALLALRVMAPWDTRWLWNAWAVSLALAAAVCAGIAGRRPYTLTDSLARLDQVGGLHNRLTSAFEGIGPWPRSVPGIRDTVRWNWARLGVPVLIGGLLLGAAALLELPALTLNARPSEEPIAWTQLENWLQTLDQAKILDQPALEKLKEQVDDLLHQPEQDWYSQSSLEAGDALQQQTAQSLRELQQNLEKASELVAQAQQTLSASQLQTLSSSLKDLALGMQSGNLPVNKALTANFDPSTLKAMSPRQMQALEQRLSDGAKVCSQCVGPNPCGLTGTSQKPGQFPSGHPGGGGTAPLGLDNDAENLHTKRTEGASNDDPARALPAEVIAIAKGKPNADQTNIPGPLQAGAISSTGQGGDAVWRDSLTPDERQVLQSYFK
jgi:hypothetical protein